ncbi:hypothetical protein M422DRAFT_30542 [Sphaerobolus stellatus SS14]|uniref:Cytochrome b mRNA-processing protein 4 n=1 Tax=Sphaerobolus stellatus (strain SS14) TaxID=990650 RepID=A0A0C9VPD9_SPHS4|nr:hypothetical protein M422DRAFT_30542 [Sphaerobolus stellatus SS14]
MVLLRTAGLATVLTGGAWLLMKAIVPTPEQTYAAMSPELRKRVDQVRAARLAREAGVKEEVNVTNEDADKPVWRS